MSGTALIITGLGMLLGGGIWLGLFWRQRRQPLALRTWWVWLVAVGLVCRLAYVFLTPVFYSPDEEPHLKYVQYLIEHRAFPVQETKLGSPTNDWEYNQAPLYYLVLTPFYAVAKAVFSEPAGVVRALRLTSVGFWLVCAWLATVFLRRLQIKDGFVAVFVMAMVCLLPTYTFVSSVINNDNLLIVLGAGLVCLLAGRAVNLKISVSMGLVLGAALLTKQSAVVFVPAIGLLALLDARKGRITWRAALVHLIVVMGLAGVFFVPWMLRNWQVYHSFTPEYLVSPRVPWTTPVDGWVSAGHNLLKSFWSVSGISNNVGYPFPLLGMGLLALCVLGQQAWIKQTPAESPVNLKANGPLLAALTVAVVVNVALVLRFGYLFGMGQGRHLYGVLLPLALLLAAGLRPLPLRQAEAHAAGYWIFYALSFTAFSLAMFP